MTQYSVLGLTFTTLTDNLPITEVDIHFLQKKKQSMQFSTLSWRKTMAKKRYRKFEKNFSKQTTEEVNRIILDHLVPTDMWDSKKYCSASWTITVNLQSWEELENNK